MPAASSSARKLPSPGGEMLQPSHLPSRHWSDWLSAGRTGISSRHNHALGFEVCTSWNEVASCIRDIDLRARL